MNEETLRAKLEQAENPWVERKESFQEEKVLRALVGFANSVPDGEESAVLFLGASNGRGHPGIADADDAQKKINGLVTGRAYPPIKVFTAVLDVLVGGVKKEILCVIVPPSSLKPHFSGAAWVRRGSETVRASEEMLNELIASRNDKVRRLQKFKDKKVMFGLLSRQLGLRIDYENARLISVDATTVVIDTGEGSAFPFSTASVETFDQMATLVRVNAPSPWTEQEHIAKMIDRWVSQNPEVNGIAESRSRYLADQVLANLQLTLNSIRWAARMTPAKAQKVLLSMAEMITREQRIG
jgi:hypothetical protein